ncbi:MAG: 30S ribosomal protein S2 [Bacteroidetes bacterium]|nr:30S ribosomal protein S2 [Bacteroidota bacterium]
MSRVTLDQLLDAGVHFGHLKSKWDPAMAPYIFMEKNGIHVIDLYKTVKKLDQSCDAIKNIAKSGRKVLFVATKKQAKDIVIEAANSVNMPYVTERWLGGMLTNFATVRKSIKKMQNIDKMEQDGTFQNMAKRERLQLTRERDKLNRVLGGIADLTRIPAALFIIDVKKEHIAVAEASKLNLTSFGMVDTNSDPRLVDYAIPANDDSTKSIELITGALRDSIAEGLAERKRSKDEQKEDASKETAEERTEA